MAEGIMRRLVVDADLVADILVESAGTGNWHVGERADRRARDAAARHGISLTSRAQVFTRADFVRFDHVIAMDQSNLTDLRRICPNKADGEKLSLLRAYDPGAPPDAEVPDPYVDGQDAFDEVFDLCHAACRGLLARLQAMHYLPTNRG